MRCSRTTPTSSPATEAPGQEPRTTPRVGNANTPPTGGVFSEKVGGADPAQVPRQPSLIVTVFTSV